MCRDSLRDEGGTSVETRAGDGPEARPEVRVNAETKSKPRAKAEAKAEEKAKGKAKEKAKERAKERAMKGGVTLLVALYLPICILAMGMVFDLGLAFVVRQTAQAACDMGALAAVQELDWDKLAEGMVVINPAAARQQAADITFTNLAPLVRKGLVTEPVISATVSNPSGGAGGAGEGEPAVMVQASMTVRTFFLRWLPGLARGIPITVRAEARCVERTNW
ncbi:MAG: Tad domain-containing protein [Firmicutes bacterium]|nr:Tad domain-containing protein [Candidatus Fermentithermobacillaceae bacterium]